MHTSTIQEDGTIQLTFESTDERDKFIAREFPSRRADQNSPGLYYLGDGRIIQVMLNYVGVYPRHPDGIIGDESDKDNELRTELAMLARLLKKHRNLMTFEHDGAEFFVHQIMDYSNELHCQLKVDLRFGGFLSVRDRS